MHSFSFYYVGGCFPWCDLLPFLSMFITTSVGEEVPEITTLFLVINFVCQDLHHRGLSSLVVKSKG